MALQPLLRQQIYKSISRPGAEENRVKMTAGHSTQVEITCLPRPIPGVGLALITRKGAQRLDSQLEMGRARWGKLLPPAFTHRPSNASLTFRTRQNSATTVQDS